VLIQSDQELISVWRDSAPFWENHREIIRQMFAPVTAGYLTCFDRPFGQSSPVRKSRAY
jgi:hypothetical protein